MNEYETKVWNAVSEVISYAQGFGIEADETKVSTLIAQVMFPNVGPDVFRARVSEIREVAELYVIAMRAIDSAKVLA